MSGDIALLFSNATQTWDWCQTATGDIADTQAVGLSDLETAVVISLFNDKVVPPDWTFPQKGILNDPRGWWGDAFNQYPIGSNLWLLRFQSGAPNLLQIARDYCNDALQWLLDYNIAASITVVTSWIFPDSTRAMGIAINITEPVTNITTQFQYAWAWQQITNVPPLPIVSAAPSSDLCIWDQGDWDEYYWGG